MHLKFIPHSLLALLVWSLPGSASQEPTEQETRGAAFSKLLTGSVLDGWYTDSNAPDAPPKKDRYTMGRVSKLEDGRWRIESKVEYGERSFTVPLNLRVEWAGDTPVITLDKMAIPGMGTFTARVLFYGTGYAGTWEGGGHGGQMMGRIERDAAPVEGGSETPAPDETAPAEEEAGEDVPPADDTNWPSFRGADARGWAEGHPVATHWELESGENVRFRVPVPGLAHSSPVVWGERVFVSTAVKHGEAERLVVGLYGNPADVDVESSFDYVVFCFDKTSGEVLWDSLAWQGRPKFARHPKSSHASSTPATDGNRLVVSFGTEGLFCFDLEGELLWTRDLGNLDAGPYSMQDVQWGYASSPVIHEGRVLVQCDGLSQQFVAALDLETGKDLWRTPREDLSTWGSPTVDVRSGRSQVLCNGFKHIGGYDLETGAELWKLVGGGDAPVPTPVVAGDLIYISNAHGRMSPIYAIRADATGTIDMEHESMAWVDPRRGNYMQTPLVYGNELYLCSDAGILACRDALSGEEHYRERLGDGSMGFTASMVAAAGLLYATSETGEVFVVRAGTSFEPLGQYSLGEECMATPAISEGVIYWRTRSNLIAIGPG
jgi:outer membrane protein assembly factor BamB